MTGSSARTVLVTGFPGRQLAVHLVRELCRDKRLLIHCLVTESQQERALELIAQLPASAHSRVSLLLGDPRSLDLGLSGEEFTILIKQLEVIYHCACITDPAGTKEEGAGNVKATVEILELAESSPRLKRLVCWSSAIVSGNREGFVMEDELSEEGFRNPIEESLHKVELMVREVAEELPVVIIRPALLVGDSVTGEVDDLNGLYLLIRFLLSAPDDFRIPSPSRGGVRISAVPVDYAVRAGLHIATDDRSLGRTFHVVDPKPVTVQRALQLFAKATGKPLPKEHDPLNLATALLRTPGLQRFTHTTRAFLDHLKTDVIYDDRNTRELLRGSQITCPPLESYVDLMVDRARRGQTL
ncbi:MAG: SDR family oxidoreductase [Deltaproteobacteria bacterium]|nr:SDR family oxidoreductase [Deltaproteobacteria bacterium]